MLQDNSQKVFKQRIRSVLIGCAYGDAFGMAAEGMSFNAIHNAYPKGINEFLPSINHGISDRIFPAGSITNIRVSLQVKSICDIYQIGISLVQLLIRLLGLPH